MKTDINNPVVLVHGIKDDSRRMEPMARYLRGQGRTAYAVTLKPSWGQVGIDQLAAQLDQFIKEKIPDSQKFDLVGFSMGGLVSRYYLQRMDGLRRVDHFITLATPHHGTVMAWLAWNTGGSQMRPESAFLQDLNHDISTLDLVKFTSIWTPLDLMIVPATSSHTGIGREIKIWMPAHPLMALHPKCIRVVAAELLR
ncbi:MAG: alpha/beta fold hydrolase [Verrucomicrobiota bacterium]